MDKYTKDDFRRMEVIASNLRYVADALNVLDSILNLPDCNTCAKYGECEYMPEWGAMVRFNCPLYEKPKEG